MERPDEEIQDQLNSLLKHFINHRKLNGGLIYTTSFGDPAAYYVLNKETKNRLPSAVSVSETVQLAVNEFHSFMVEFTKWSFLIYDDAKEHLNYDVRATVGNYSIRCWKTDLYSFKHCHVYRFRIFKKGVEINTFHLLMPTTTLIATHSVK